MNRSAMDAWKPYQPTAEFPWDLRRVAHLHRRAGFAAPWSRLQSDLADGPEESITRFLQGDRSIDHSEFDILSETIGSAAVNSSNPQRLQAWWLYRMLKTHDPLGERLTLMWHNHFATSNRKVKNLALMHQQNQLFRENARAPFGQLLSAVVKHPAMLIWLDGDSNRKGRSNENLAREMLELFTLGAGNYSETDVKESARALTGWAVVNDGFEFRAALHDDAELNILGVTQPFTGEQLMERLLTHRATARRVAWRICKTFMGEEFVSNSTNRAAMEELAAGLVKKQVDVKWAVETVLRSQLFFADANIRSKVLGSTEFVVGAIRSLELEHSPPSTLLLAQWLTRMGQDLFYPPNVGGWNEGRSWLSSRTIVARSNFASAHEQRRTLESDCFT